MTKNIIPTINISSILKNGYEYQKSFKTIQQHPQNTYPLTKPGVQKKQLIVGLVGLLLSLQCYSLTFSQFGCLIAFLMTALYVIPKLNSNKSLVSKKTNNLVMDFIIEQDNKSLHILNAVSPAWTCALSFSEYVVDQI